MVPSLDVLLEFVHLISFFYNAKVFLVLLESYAIFKILMSSVGLFCLISDICWVDNMGVFLQVFKLGIHAKAA